MSSSPRALTAELRAWANRYRGPSSSNTTTASAAAPSSESSANDAAAELAPPAQPSSEHFTVHLKTIDNSTHPVCVHAQLSVAELKQLAEPLVGIPVQRQRLVFRGKVLRDEQTVSCLLYTSPSPRDS